MGQSGRAQRKEKQVAAEEEGSGKRCWPPEEKGLNAQRKERESVASGEYLCAGNITPVISLTLTKL